MSNYAQKRGAFRKAAGNANTNANNNAAKSDAPISSEVESYKAKMPEGSDIKFATIAKQVQYTDSGNKSMSINFNKLLELVDAGVLTVNEAGYINNVRVFGPFKG